MSIKNRYDCISPLDYRYYGDNPRVFDKLHPYFSEEANVKFVARVEAAIVRAFAKHGICSQEVADQIDKAAANIDPAEVSRIDAKIHHYTKAIVNAISEQVAPEAARFVHLGITSADVMDTAQALKVKEFTLDVLLPDLLDIESRLIALAEHNLEAPQIGRTHGQHAVPITFGFAIAEYVDRLGYSILKINEAAHNLHGAISGAVGACNATSLFCAVPVQLESDILQDLGLKRALHSTQIVPPEYMNEIAFQVLTCFGIFANFSDDMRHLQRTEISEVRESFGKDQVGSSTMPHKRNPWNFEHIKSMWKEFMPKIVSLMLNQISEHQRDLSNSASQRFIPEIFVAFYDTVERLQRIMKGLNFDAENAMRNLVASKDFFVAEPVYILLSQAGLANAHEHVRKLTLQAEKERKSVYEVLVANDELKAYLDKFTEPQIALIKDPVKYSGKAAQKAKEVCNAWRNNLAVLGFSKIASQS